MTGNTLSKIDIINAAREEAGLTRVAEATALDNRYYESERVTILSSGYFGFAKRRIRLSQLSQLDNGGYILPTDYIAAVSPTIAKRLENVVWFSTCCGTGAYVTADYSSGYGEFEYVFNETATENFDRNFVDSLIYGMAARYARYKVDAQREAMYNRAKASILMEYQQVESMNTPIRVYR